MNDKDEFKSVNENVDNRKENPWYLKKSFVILMLFFVLGPLAIPLLLVSKEFSITEKIIYTIIIMAITIIFIAFIIFIVKLYMARLKLIRDIMN